MVSGRLKSFGLAAAVLALAALAVPAQAQFGGVFGGSRRSQASDDDKCTESKRSTGSRIAGEIGRAHV